MAYIELRTADINSMEVCLGDLDNSYEKDNRVLFWNYKKSYETNWQTYDTRMELKARKKRSERFVINNLSSGTVYNIRCICVFSGSTELSKEFTEFYTTYWAWDNLRRGELVKDTSYTEWNALVDAIRSVLYIERQNAVAIGSNNYGKPNSTTYEELLNLTKIEPSDKTLYAEKFNYLRYCIGSVKSTGISDKYKGSMVDVNDFYTISNIVSGYGNFD